MKYIKQIQAKDPHERRAHAMQIAGVLTAFMFFVWITTLGLRLTTGGGAESVANDASQAASFAASAYYTSINGGLEVASTSNISY